MRNTRLKVSQHNMDPSTLHDRLCENKINTGTKSCERQELYIKRVITTFCGFLKVEMSTLNAYKKERDQK